MSFEFQCAHCGTLIEAQPEQRGTTCNCPACETAIVIPLSHLTTGQEFAGFELKKLLGSGTFGQVFLGVHQESGQSMALKIMPDDVGGDEGKVSERFMNEVAMMARITHPNVVPATKAGACGGYYFLAMDFINGVNLEDRVETDGAMGEGEILAITMQVVEALDYAWGSHKVIHRDIKPANIMITDDGEVKLMDLGLSKSGYDGKDVLQTESSVVGTPYYMSPEQVEGKDIDWRSDQYSLAATMFHLLTGHPPFEAESCPELLTEIVEAPTPKPSQFAPDVSRGVDKMLGYMMQKDPENRYDSWQQVMSALRRVNNGTLPQAPEKLANTATSDGIRRSRLRNAGRTNPGSTTVNGVPAVGLSSGPGESGSSTTVTRGVGRSAESSGDTRTIPASTRSASYPKDSKTKSEVDIETPMPASGSELKSKEDSATMRSWLLAGGIGLGILIIVLVIMNAIT